MNYCSQCGAAVALRTPDGDDRPRHVCQRCGAVHYRNPLMVVGCIPRCEGRILLCRRAIAPRRGLWTLPAGYLENGETLAAGARRETREEAGAVVEELAPYQLFNLTFVNQIYLMFRGRMAEPRFEPGTESLEVRLFAPQEIPWGEIAFSVIRASLERYLADSAQGVFPFFMGDIARPNVGGSGEGQGR
jgi:ADP-ribose pyrophosphatase YjhB (NUDIX family)